MFGFRVITLLCFLLFTLPVFSAPHFTFSPRCVQAYQEIMKWKLEEGRRLIELEKKSDPENLIPSFLENYIDFFVLFFNEDPSEYSKKKSGFDKRLELMNTGPASSPYHLFTRAVIHFQRAAVEVKFKNTWAAGWEFRRCFLQVKKLREEHPDFKPGKIYSGAMKVAAGTIPDGYKWLSNLLGIRGNMKAGMNELKGMLDDKKSELYYSEALFYYLYLKFYIENDKSGVFRILQQEGVDLKSNHLFAFLAVNLGINGQRSAWAEEVLKNRLPGKEYFATPVWQLEYGYASIYQLKPEASAHFIDFIENFKGKFYVKDALLKLSWSLYLAGDQQRAEHYRSLILKKGDAFSESDKLAYKEAAQPWPNQLLLKARLLNDGGFYFDALRLLQGKTMQDFATVPEQLEFAYRAGRLYDALGSEKQALLFYQQVVHSGSHRQEYFAARSALQIGYIHENKGQFDEAVTWFNRCLAMKEHDFKNSIDQKAKAGLQRVKEKTP